MEPYHSGKALRSGKPPLCHTENNAVLVFLLLQLQNSLKILFYKYYAGFFSKCYIINIFVLPELCIVRKGPPYQTQPYFQNHTLHFPFSKQMFIDNIAYLFLNL